MNSAENNTCGQDDPTHIKHTVKEVMKGWFASLVPIPDDVAPLSDEEKETLSKWRDELVVADPRCCDKLKLLIKLELNNSALRRQAEGYKLAYENCSKSRDALGRKADDLQEAVDALNSQIDAIVGEPEESLADSIAEDMHPGAAAIMEAMRQNKLTLTAPELLKRAAALMAERGKQYDQPNGERSMGKTVAAFNAVTGRQLTESEGWLLMLLLKQVRQWQRKGYHADSAEDAIAYSALLAEAKQEEAQ